MTPQRVFGVDYQFLACGDVFTQGLARAAAKLGLAYQHADCRERYLPDLIERHHPDLILVVHGRVAHARLGRAAKTSRTAIWLLDEPYEVDDTSRFASGFDHVFVNDAATLGRHPRSTYLPVCYDPQLHTPGDRPRPYQVGFIGGANPARERVLAALDRSGVLSYVVGGRWDSPAVQRRCLAPNIPPSQTVQLYQQTQIVVNVFRTQHHFNRDLVAATALNPRVYEAFACGALVVSEWRPEADTIVPEMPTFRTDAECVTLIRDLLADPVRAEAIRAACAARLAPHTYRARLETVIDVCQMRARVEAVA